MLDKYQPHESCPEVDGATYRPEVYKIPKVRMFEIWLTKTANERVYTMTA